MKGFRTEITTGFQKGLRHVSGAGPNVGFLTECLNARISEGGRCVEGYLPDITAFPSITGVTATADWPFPQLFHADDTLYVGNAVSMYQLSVLAGVWSGTNLASTFTHGITWPWSFAKFPMFPVFTCGDLLVYYDYAATAWKFWQYGDPHASAGSKWGATWHQPVSMCNFRGQAICGGAKTATTAPGQSRLVRWSEIGSFDFLGMTATTRKNEAGERFLETDDKEIIMAVLPMEGGVVVYGTFSVWAMIPVAAPAATFAWKQIFDFGIANPMAAGTNGKEQLFVSRNGKLMKIASDFEVTELGYDEFLLPLQASPSIATSTDLIKVSWVPWEMEWHIGSNERMFIYREGGLTETIRIITGLVNLENAAITDAASRSTITSNPYGFFSDLSPTDAAYMKIVTDTYNFGYNGIKEIEYVEVVGDLPNATTMQVAIDYKYSKTSSAFTRSTWIRMNPEGVAVPIVSGTDLRICLKVTPYTDAKIYGINVGWKATDKRHIRGVYDALSNNTRSAS